MKLDLESNIRNPASIEAKEPSVSLENKPTKTAKELSLNNLKHTLTSSSRLAELKASIARFRDGDTQLKTIEARTEQIKKSFISENLKSIELEINVSPKIPQSPAKAYLSPKKDTSARRNLCSLLSPSKSISQVVPISPLKSVTIKETLILPFKYRFLAEMFRAIDTVSQILCNRKETITFKKLKSAVEEMLKRNLYEKHLAQIKFLYPDAFSFRYDKLREFGTGTRREQWELVITPEINQTSMTSEILLERRRKFYNILINKLKIYHQEFLTTLDPSMELDHDKITRWHPEFDIEKVPDVEVFTLPKCPDEEKFTTGSEVLEKAKSMFNCNTRMEQALERLKQVQQTTEVAPKEVEEDSIFNGIPKALLEKVRQKQAAKALEAMTRSSTQDQEAQLYSQLPEVARLARNLFVSEKKSVLPIGTVTDKLCNSYRVLSNKTDMELYLKTIAKEVPGWLVFHDIRGSAFIKVSKNSDMTLVMNKLKKEAEKRTV